MKNELAITIEYKYFDGRYTRYNKAEVTLAKTYQGHDIYKDAEDLYFVNDGSNYQYFDSVREAQKFIRNTAWEG